MRFIETTQKRITDSEMSTTSVVVAYYLLLSLFPLIIAFGNILPFLHIDQELWWPCGLPVKVSTLYKLR